MSVDQIVIIGAGDHGRGTLDILNACNAVVQRYEVMGFVDDSVDKQGRTIGQVPVLGDIAWLEANHSSEYAYLIAIADCRTKRRIAERLARIRLRYISATHPTAVLGTGVQLGVGNIIGAGVVIAYDTNVDEHCTINLNATVGHDCVIGRYCTIAPGANVAGRVRFEEGCDVGLNAAIGKGTQVKAWSAIGIGSVVIRDVPSEVHVFGNPARVVRTEV